MTNGKRILNSQQFSDLVSRHFEPPREAFDVEVRERRKRLASELLSDNIGRGQAMRTAESLKARAFYRLAVQFDLEPDPEAETPILSGPCNNPAGVGCQRAGRGQGGKPLPNLGTVIHRLECEV